MALTTVTVIGAATRVGSLRKEYGANFAKGRRRDMMLKTLLKETGLASLHEYLRTHHR